MSKLQVERGNMLNFQAQGSILHLLGGRAFGKDFIGKEMFVEYGERSGVAQVPFHVKQTYIIDK